MPDFRHDGFGKLKFPEVLPPDADDGTGKVEIRAVVDGQHFAETQRAVADEQKNQPEPSP